jgi:hypothetical protein
MVGTVDEQQSADIDNEPPVEKGNGHQDPGGSPAPAGDRPNDEPRGHGFRLGLPADKIFITGYPNTCQ